MKIKSHFKFFSLFLLVAACFSYSEEAKDLDELLNEFMAKKLEFFENLAKSPNLRSTNLNKSEGYLLKMLKKQQSFYSFLRINSKGVVANELVRQETEPEKKFRDISDQRGFLQMANKQEPYYTWIRNEGRHYLLWMHPVLSSSGSFIGGIAAKVDIWDLIHEFSQNTDIHFLVKIGKKSLYSHKWKEVKSFYKRPVVVAGLDELEILYEKPKEAGNITDWESVPDTFSTLPEESPKAEVKKDSSEAVAQVEETPAEASSKKSKLKVPLAMAVFGLLALILAIAFIKVNSRKSSVL